MGTPRLRKDGKIYLIGESTHQIIGSKLPSNKQVLQVLFHNVREVKLTVDDSAKLVIEEVQIFWDKARIPVKRQDHSVEKLIKLYHELRSLQKKCTSRTEGFVRKENAFIEKLDDLFDIAHAEAEKLIKIEEDRLFLLNQRKKGRVGNMIGIDKKLAEKEKRIEERREKEAARLERALEASSSSLLEKMDSSSSESQSSNFSDLQPAASLEAIEKAPVPPKKRKQGSKNIITPKVVAALDKCKVSERDAVHLITSIVQALDIDVMPLTLSRTTIQRYREKIRIEASEKLKINFEELSLEAPVIHWDGKLFTNYSDPEKSKHDRLAVIVTSGKTEKILGVPKLENSTGREQATAIYEQLLNWNLQEDIKALCCDTTSSNLGHIKGAAVFDI